MSGKIIIIITITLLIVAFNMLFIIETKNHSYDYKKSWSVVYFENPRDASLDFVIENHQGEKAIYEYKILVDDKKVIENETEIDAGGKFKISPVIDGEKLNDKRVIVSINYKDTEYKIYKDIK